MRTEPGLAFVSLAAFLTLIVKCEKWMRPCVVSMTTLLSLMKCTPTIGAVKVFNTSKCSENISSPVTNLIGGVANGVSNWPFAT